MSIDSAHKSKWAIAEVVFGLPFLLSIILQFMIPFSVPPGILRQALVAVGIIFIIAGISFIVLARRKFADFHQPTDPGQATTEIVTTGVFSISRNPLYFGGAMLLLGISLALNMLWSLVALLISLVLCHYVLIVPEEKYLAAKFGDAYAEYTHTVRRWFGRK